METNTVVLSLQEYNKLRDFKKTIQDGGACIEVIEPFGQPNIQWLYTKTEAIKALTQKRNELASKLEEKERERIILEVKMQGLIPQKKTITTYDIKSMSVWDFLKIKRSI